MQALIESVKGLAPKERKALAALLRDKGINLFGIVPIHRRDGNEPLQLSYAQQRQWFLWHLEPDSSAYHVVSALRLRGSLDLGSLQRSFDELVIRHESLRTTFAQIGEAVLQVIHEPGLTPIIHDELDSESEPLQVAHSIASFIEEKTRQVFDLESGPLFRVHLLRLAADDHVLVLVQHHIVSDGWSMQVTVDELIHLYSAYSQGQEARLPELPIQYADYAIWQRDWMEAGEQQRQLDYWLEHLRGEQPVLTLPQDHSRPSQQSFRGAVVDIHIDPVLSENLTAFAKHKGVTLFMLLLASFQTLLHRYTAQHDIRIGVPVANRTRTEIERLIGFFINTHVLKASIDGQMPFSDLLQQVRHTVLQAQEHQDLPFEQLVEALQPERSLSHNPLYQVMYNHQTGSVAREDARQLPGLTVESVSWERQTAQCDLTLSTFESNGALSASFTYATDLFEAATIEGLAAHWVHLLEGIVQQPDQRIAELPLLAEVERQRILHEWNQARAEYPSDRCIHELIEAQVCRAPDAVAVLFEDRQLTYAELNHQANQLAHKLIELGVGPDVRVGIAMERSLEMVVGLLGILKAGGTYVPLDPEYPRERLAYMAEDSGIGFLLTQSGVQDCMPALPGVLSLCMDQEANWLEGYGDDNPVPRARYDSAAYIIFTSGSTGTPKGVTIPHGAFAMHCQAAAQRYGITDRDCMLQFASISFDAAAEQTFMSLAFGLRLLLGEVKQWSAEQLLEHVERHGVSILNLPPAYLAHLSESLGRVKKAVDIRLCILGGEAWNHGLLSGAIRASHIFNAYGPTEAVVTPLVWEAESGAFEGYAPIGCPVGKRKAYVLDEG